LEPTYAVVYFDALRVKIRDEGLVRNKAVYLAFAKAQLAIQFLRTHLERPAVAPLATMSGTELCQGRRMGLLGWVVQLAR
jgi:hypothetical protein